MSEKKIDSQNLKQLHLIIQGKVQGVFYRISTKEKAQEFNLVGWVKNLEEGFVEIVAEGKTEHLDLLRQWCYLGPELAYVTDILVEEHSYSGDFSKFDIRH